MNTGEQEHDWSAELEVPPPLRSHCPGRVNLIGDHTDYNDGLAMPMAIDLGTDVLFEPDSSHLVVFGSNVEQERAEIHVRVALDHDILRTLNPPWTRYVAGMVAAIRPRRGGWGRITTTLPLGAGLSSSAALCVSVALALGFEGPPSRLAKVCQIGEEAATGVKGGMMDQLVTTSAIEGTALLVDFSDLSSQPVRVPDGAEFVVVHSGQSRHLPSTAYQRACGRVRRGLLSPRTARSRRARGDTRHTGQDTQKTRTSRRDRMRSCALVRTSARLRRPGRGGTAHDGEPSESRL